MLNLILIINVNTAEKQTILILIIYLVEVEKMEVEYYTNEFRNKCTSKELKPEDFHDKLEQKLPQYKARWKNSMNDQIKDLPDFEQVEREVSRKIKNFMN